MKIRIVRGRNPAIYALLAVAAAFMLPGHIAHGNEFRATGVAMIIIYCIRRIVLISKQWEKK